MIEIFTTCWLAVFTTYPIWTVVLTVILAVLVFASVLGLILGLGMFLFHDTSWIAFRRVFVMGFVGGLKVLWGASLFIIGTIFLIAIINGFTCGDG